MRNGAAQAQANARIPPPITLRRHREAQDLPERAPREAQQAPLRARRDRPGGSATSQRSWDPQHSVEPALLPTNRTSQQPEQNPAFPAYLGWWGRPRLCLHASTLALPSPFFLRRQPLCARSLQPAHWTRPSTKRSQPLRDCPRTRPRCARPLSDTCMAHPQGGQQSSLLLPTRPVLPRVGGFQNGPADLRRLEATHSSASQGGQTGTSDLRSGFVCWLTTFP